MGGLKCCQKMAVKEFNYNMPAISLQASKFTKNELLHTYFQGFQLEFKLFIVLFLGIISWKVFMGGFFEKNCRMGGAPPHPPLLWETLSFCRGVEPPTKFSKLGSLTGPQLLKGVAGKEEVTFFRGLQFSQKNKLESEIFNDKKFISKSIFLCPN